MTKLPLFAAVAASLGLALLSSLAQRPASADVFDAMQAASWAPRQVLLYPREEGTHPCERVVMCFGARPASDGSH